MLYGLSSRSIFKYIQMMQLAEKLRRYRTQFSEISAEAADLTEGLTEEQFNWKPKRDRWSVGQCIDHLNTAGYMLLPRLEIAIREGRENGVIGEPPFHYGFVSRWFIRFNEPSSSFKMKTFNVYAPATSSRLKKESTIRRFAELQNELTTRVEEAHGLDLRKIKVPSPVSSLLRLNLGAWFEATVAHERRHLKQAREVMQNANYPSAS